ncbi:MAG: LptA/OstA family protein [Holosporales bacterium]|jgi:lipopolysaccharide export system protein LptA|nr:LptA/OstA family protein [Holosporales bacterium]
MRYVILFFLLYGLQAQTEEPVQPAKNSSTSVEISAGSLVADQKENTILLQDKVEATHADTHLWADEVWTVSPPGTQFGFKNPKTVGVVDQVIATRGQPSNADTSSYVTGERPPHGEGDQILTSDESIDYWEDDLKAVARHNVILHVKDKIVKTDELVMFFKKNVDGHLELTYAYSPQRVSIATPEEVFTGDRGQYDAATGEAVLEGNASVTRLSDQSCLSGAYASINLSTGISKLYATPPAISQAKPASIQGKLPVEKKTP